MSPNRFNVCKVQLIRSSIAALMLVTSEQTLADEAKARLGRVMWAAFECGTYADMFGDQNRAQSLYNFGIEAGREFLGALRSKDITPEELKATVPIGVTMRLGGSSDDIMIGRILEASIGDAYDKVVKQDANGMPLETSAWVSDESLKSMIARNKFTASNCDLIR